MRAEDLQEVLHAEPFEPFRVHLASGRSIDVLNPGLAAVSRSGRRASIFDQHDTWNMVDIMRIDSIELLGGSNGAVNGSPS